MAAAGVMVGAVESIVIERDDESTLEPPIVARATIVLTPAVSEPVVQVQAPVEELAVHELPLLLPFTKS